MALISVNTFAAPGNCLGSDSFYTCNDSSGNSYTVSKFGNTTNVQGNNYRTGSSWNQSTQNYGNSSYTTGRDKDGNTWRQNTNQIGDSTYYNGQDSNGNYYNGSCNPYSGCRTNR